MIDYPGVLAYEQIREEMFVSLQALTMDILLKTNRRGAENTEKEENKELFYKVKLKMSENL